MDNSDIFDDYDSLSEFISDFETSVFVADLHAQEIIRLKKNLTDYE